MTYQAPLTVHVPARQLRVGDYVRNDGEIIALRTGTEYVVTTIRTPEGGTFTVFYAREQKIEIHLEDDRR